MTKTRSGIEGKTRRVRDKNQRSDSSCLPPYLASKSPYVSNPAFWLADDHAVVRAGTRQFLETDNDFTVIAEADDGASAKQLIAEHSPDIAVLDIRMPHANGIEVTRWVRTHHPTVRVLILTAYDDDPYIKAVLDAGANGYILKTAPPLTLTQAVSRYLCRQNHLSGQQLLRNWRNLLLIAERIKLIMSSLTERELEVLQRAARGDTNKAIALHLGISSRTAQGHLANIYSKLRVSSRTEAVMKAVQLNMIEI